MKIHSHIDLKLPQPSLAGKRGVNLKPGQSLTLKADIPAAQHPTRRKLRIVGEIDLFWRWRHEGGMHLLYRSISDALDSKNTFAEKYSLRLTGHNETWPRNAYMKVRISPQMRGKSFTFAAMTCAQNLQIQPQGELVIELGIYQSNPLRHPDDISDFPDKTIRIPVPQGTYDWQELTTQYTPQDSDILLLIRVGGRGFSGAVNIGSPRLYEPGNDTVIPPFMPENAEENWRSVVWLGENLSRVEWPEFTLAVDGKPASKPVPTFQPMSRGADFELPLPDLTRGQHTLTLALHADYDTALPFNIWEAAIIEESARPVELLAHPEYISQNTPFPALFEINTPAGSHLQVVQIPPNPDPAHTTFTAQIEGKSFKINPKRAIDTAGSHDILLSVSEHHIPQTPEAFHAYLAWYVAHNLGNAIGFRPIYNWTGTRQTNPETWKYLVPILTALKLRYFIIRDGRSLPGRAANPSDSLLAGSEFLGRQTHERDGNFVYGAFKRQWNAFWGDLFRRPVLPGSDDNLILGFKRMLTREGNRIRLHVPEATDMRQAALELVQNLAAERESAARHTGPTTLFSYFYQAGYDWLGAETMYGPEEPLLSALRGASTAHGKSDFGAHLAMSWASAPHDTPGHAHRYFLSLATCYLQGVTHINLEDGLIRMDAEYAAHDQYSHACRIHRETHTKFRRFLQTHPRRGTPRIPIAVLQGRYCGWQSFYRETVFGNQRPDFKFSHPEESFDLLNTFYPRSTFDAIYRLDCHDDKPEGWYTGTPFGPVDITPLAAHGPLNQYQALAFLGWNSFEEQDFQQLLAYVQQGGTLLLSKKHLSAHTVRNQPAALPRTSPALEALLGDIPLKGPKITRQVGKGQVIYFPQDAYPSEPSLREAYQSELQSLGQAAVKAESARGWIEGSPDLNFTVYDRPDGIRVIYLLNIDHWTANLTAPAHLLWAGNRYELAVPKGQIMVITLTHDLAVIPQEADVDIITIAQHRITLQSDAGARLTVFERGHAPRIVESSRSGVDTIAL